MDRSLIDWEAEYCPPLDPPLLHAILSDFDLTRAASRDEAKQVLDNLRDSAELEAATTFDETGSALSQVHGLDELEGGRSTFIGGSISTATDSTSLSSGHADFSAKIENGAHGVASELDDDAQLDKLDAATKEMLFLELFPEVNKFTIAQALKQSDENWQRTLDELLNITAFAELHTEDGHKISSKGIDAFAVDQIHKRGRNRKFKGQQGLDYGRISSRSPVPVEGAQLRNKWQSASEDIHFITTHSKLSDSLVRSTYYANGASISKTIACLLKDLMESMAPNVAVNQIIEAHASELGHDFPTVSPAYLTALVQLTHPSTASAHELAKALVAKNASPADIGPIVPKYAALSLSDDTDLASTPSPMPHPGPSIPNTRFTSHKDLADSHRETHQRLSAQAAAAYRRSRSNPLYGGAAAYYSTASREHASHASAHSSSAARTLVAAQSSPTQMDLHGVKVSDALVIARDGVQDWWQGLGEDKFNGRVGAGAREAGYRIVVGLGRHSEGGKGKIGPAVLKMLVAEGWKVESTGGVLTVFGKTKKGVDR